MSYTYDVSDQLVGVAYGTATTVLQYDLGGRKLAMDDPDMGDWSYTYDALGNLLSQVDGRGCNTTLTYDLLSRPTGKSYSGSCGVSTAAVAYTYDQGTNGVGQRTRMEDGSGYTTWSYDSRGRAEYETQVINGSGTFLTQYAYNSADLPVWMRYPADNSGAQGEVVNYSYNTQMLLDRVYGTDTYVDDTWYDAAGRVTRRELGANYILGQTYTYFPWTQQGGRLQSLQSGIAADTDSLQDLSYSYDAVGNVLSINDYKAGGTQTQTFTYDALDRLASAVASGGAGGTYALQNYTYNPDTGNLASNAGVNYTYSDSAHQHAVTGTSNGNSYGYDANGNQATRTVGGITYTLLFDAENRLVQIKKGSNVQATYTYNGDGNRVKAEVGSTTTTFVGKTLEWSGSTASMKRYYNAGGQRVAMREGSGTLYFLLTDHLGSTAITATSSGGWYSELRYFPWGGTRYEAGTTPTSYRYTGQREAEVGLYFFNARFYDSSIGRFVQPDTLIPDPGDPMSYDRFAYVNNAPLNSIDPSGHDLIACTKPGVMHCGGGGTTKGGMPVGETVRGVGTQTLPRDIEDLLYLLIPSHVGLRGQVEASFDLGLGVSGTIGVNIVYNRISDELALNADWSFEGGVGIGGGGSATGGVLIGWGSSRIEDIISGWSGIISATAAAEGAVSMALVFPIDVESMSLHIDPMTGQTPATLYFGGGSGGGYAGIGAGVNRPTSIGFNLSNLLPWNWGNR